MGRVKYNINYGTKDIEEIFELIINDKINEVTRNIKKGEIARYNKSINEDLSTNCKENQEVVKK